MKMEWWGKMRKKWGKMAKRFGLRKNGLGKLQNDIETCEYEDVHILWEMLKREDKQLTGSDKETFWNNCFQWVKRAPFPCNTGSCSRAM